jgi:branched-chain amino acid transport system ATP-binding protein
MGIGRTFQNIALFQNLSVLDNVRIGTHSLARSDYFSDAFYLPWSRRSERFADDLASELIDYLALAPMRPSGLPIFPSERRSELNWHGPWPRSRRSCCWTSLPAA